MSMESDASFLPFVGVALIYYTQQPQHLLLTLPQFPMNFCTFSLMMFKVRPSHWTAETHCGRKRIQNSQQLCPELMHLTFQAAQTKTFPPSSASPMSVLWLTGHCKAVLAEGSHILLSHCWQCFMWTISVILYSCSHVHPVFTCLFPLIWGMTLAWSSLIPLLCSSCALWAGIRECKHKSRTYL